MKTIAFVGGGTLGPVTPLIAVAKAIAKWKMENGKMEFVWFGTANGPERAVVEAEGFRFIPITVAKLPRHLSLKLLTFPFDLRQSRLESRKALLELKPNVVVTAGGFTGVPVVKEAAKLGIPCVMHQLDKVPGLSNRAIAKLCTSVTTSFAYDKSPFGSVASDRIATPVRFLTTDLPTRKDACQRFGFDAQKPVVVIIGGGTGASSLNKAVNARLDKWLAFTQVLHVTGKGKIGARADRPGYVVREFLDVNGMKDAYAVADFVVTRAGIGALSEIASLSKPSMIIPIPGNQQEENARAFHRAKAGYYFKQDQEDFSGVLVGIVKQTLMDKAQCTQMGEAAHAFFPTDDGTALAERIMKMIV